MRIKKIISQDRRDFQALYECDHCEHCVKGSGYDDQYFHEVVVPSMVCESCGKKAGDSFRALAPKYGSNTVV
jgi:C4-type Zn-finger protein